MKLHEADLSENKKTFYIVQLFNFGKNSFKFGHINAETLEHVNLFF